MAFESLESPLQRCKGYVTPQPSRIVVGNLLILRRCKGESLFLEIFIRWNLLYKGVKGAIVHSYICGGLNILYMQRL